MSNGSPDLTVWRPGGWPGTISRAPPVVVASMPLLLSLTQDIVGSPGDGAEAGGRLINVNTASQAELEALPVIGPVIARRIIEGRPYRSVDDLDRVKGIGKKRLEEIRPLYQDANPPVERRRID
jgi:competence protein ComEA